MNPSSRLLIPLLKPVKSPVHSTCLEKLAVVSRILLIFLDGVGIGRPDAGVNPLSDAPILGNCLPDGWSTPADGGRPDSLPVPMRREPVPLGGQVRAVDASLGVPGLPQSATGQTALFTGVNAAQLLGHHHYGFPGPQLRAALMEHSLLKRATQAGHTAAFLNAYRPLFFDLGEAVWSRPMSASSWNNRAAGLSFRTFDDLRAGQALYHDFTNRDASAVTAVSRDEEGWHVSVEVLERKAIPDQLDLLATYDVLLDEEGNIVKFDRREMRTRNEKKQRES